MDNATPSVYPRIIDADYALRFAVGTADRDAAVLGAAAQAEINIALFGRDNLHSEISVNRNPGDADNFAFLVFSKSPMASSERRQEWVMAVVATLGRWLNAYPWIEGSDVCLCDTEFIVQRRGLAVPCSLVKELARQLSLGQVSQAEVYEQINAQLRVKEVEFS